MPVFPGGVLDGCVGVHRKAIAVNGKILVEIEFCLLFRRPIRLSLTLKCFRPKFSMVASNRSSSFSMASTSTLHLPFNSSNITPLMIFVLAGKALQAPAQGCVALLQLHMLLLLFSQLALLAFDQHL